MSPTGSPKATLGGSIIGIESANNQNQNTPSESTNPFAPLQDLSSMTESLRKSTQTAAPAAARKQTTAELFASLKARREANRVKAAAAAEQAKQAQQAASEGETAATDTPKRPRSPSPETPHKRPRELMDLDQPATAQGEAVELTLIQKIRRLNLRTLDFPSNTQFRCTISAGTQPIIGGTNTKGYSINFLIDEGQYGLPHMELLFKANKKGRLNENLSSKTEDQEQFSILYHPGKRSIYSNEGMIEELTVVSLSDIVEQWTEFDKEVLQSAKNDTDREKLIKLSFGVREHELRGIVNLETWLGGLGQSVAANTRELGSGVYSITIWVMKTPGLIRALENFTLAYQARLPLLHQYYNDDLSAPVLGLEDTPPIEKIGNGMYVIHPKKLDEQGQEVRDASKKPVYDTNEPPVGFRSLPYVTDWVNAEHFMIYNGLNVIREYQFQRDQIVNLAYVDFKVFVKKMPAFRIGTEVIRVDRNLYDPKQREITSSFLVYFRTPSKEGVKETAPQEGTRVRIIFAQKPKEGKSEEAKRIWSGIVIRRDNEDYKATGCDFCVLASKPRKSFFQQAHDELVSLPDDGLQKASLKITLSGKPALRELNAVKSFCTSDNPRIQNLRNLLIEYSYPLPNRNYNFVDITGGPNNDEKLKKLFNDRINAIPGLNLQQKQALDGLRQIPNGIHVVQGPPGTAKTTMIANTVWPYVEVGHRVCCFTTTNTSADHLTNAITSICPPELEDKLVVRLNIAAVEDLMIKRSNQFDHEMPDVGQLQRPPKEQQFDEAEDSDPLYAMGLEQINQAVMENDAMLDQLYDDFMEQNTARQEAFRLLQEKASQGGSLKVPLATTLAYRIWELEMQDYIAAQHEYNAEYQERTQGLDPTAIADTVSDMRSVEDRNPSGQFRKYRKFYINQDGRVFGATKRMFKQLTKEMAIRVISKVSILIITANNAGSELADLGFEPTLLICEEGGQANIANFCVPLTVFTKWLACLLFGDIKQLEPNNYASQLNEVSLNGKVSILGLVYKKGFPTMKLRVQYRMDPDIASFPNKRFYDGDLINGDNTRQPNRTKNIMRRVSKDILKIKASTFWQVDVRNGVSRHEAGGSSLQNHANADAIYKQVSMLLDEGIRPSQITILVYYRAQLKVLAQRLKRKAADGTMERMYSIMTTVDSYQGDDNDIIIVDLVAVGRNSKPGYSQGLEMDNGDEAEEEEASAELLEPGESRVFSKYSKYAKNHNRLNVALTCAKLGLIIFCHAQSMLATSRVSKANNYEKSDLAALAKDVRDRGIVVHVEGFDDHPDAVKERKKNPR